MGGPASTARLGGAATVDFLIAAAREFGRGGWVFTGFHWPVLAGHLAYALDGKPFTQVFEAGAVLSRRPRMVPTSTTDYPAYVDSLSYVGDTASALLAMGRRYDRVVLDAANVDMTGRVNSSFIGPRDHPRVRLPGGGGAADIAWAARELILLHGGADMRRLQERVEHVTAAPGPHATVRLITRWGRVALGDAPSLLELTDTPGSAEFRAHLTGLGVDTETFTSSRGPSDHERSEAVVVLREAAERGYRVAQRAIRELEAVDHGR